MPYTIIKSIWRGFFFTLFGVGITSTVYTVVNKIDYTIPVMVVEADKLNNTTIHAGDNLEVRFITTRNFECQTMTHRYIIDDSNDVQVWGTISPAIINKVGAHQHGAVNVKTPDWLKPGSYRYQSITYNVDCLHGRSFTAAPPVLYFQVVP